MFGQLRKLLGQAVPNAVQSAARAFGDHQERPQPMRQPVQNFEDGSSLVGQRGAPRVAVDPGQGSYGYQPTQPFGQQNIGQVQSGSGQMQPSLAQYEDEWTPRDALETTGYYSPQTSLNGGFQQGSQQYPTQITRNGSDLNQLRRIIGL